MLPSAHGCGAAGDGVGHPSLPKLHDGPSQYTELSDPISVTNHSGGHGDPTQVSGGQGRQRTSPVAGSDS